MKQLVVISGKGGTGKTSILASLAYLSACESPVATADCDVDAANLALLLPGEDVRTELFWSGRRARIDAGSCSLCGLCAEQCRAAAIRIEDFAVVDPLACEGCGVCELVCPEEAVSFVDNQAGVWMERRTAFGPLIHAALGIAQDNSGKLVAQVRQEARTVAERDDIDLILVDGPPGIGCPVHASLTGCDLALVVTEPTPSGEHDLERVLELLDHFAGARSSADQQARPVAGVHGPDRGAREKSGRPGRREAPLQPRSPSCARSRRAAVGGRSGRRPAGRGVGEDLRPAIDRRGSSETRAGDGIRKRSESTETG